MKKIFGLPVLALVLTVGCETPSEPSVVPVPPVGLKLNVNPKKEYHVSIDVGAIERRRDQSVNRLRKKMTGCQEWTFDASGTLEVFYVQPSGNPLAQSRTDSLQIVKAKVMYPDAANYTSVMCILPSDVNAVEYLHELRSHRQQRGNTASKKYTIAEYKSRRGKLSTAKRIVQSYLVNNGQPLATMSAASFQTLSDNVLPTVMVYANYEWLDIPPVGVDYGNDDPPDYDEYGDETELPTLPGDDPPCEEPSCWEKPIDPNCNDAASSFPPIAQDQLGKTYESKDAYCDTAYANNSTLCVDIWINKCSVFVVGFGDCRDGTSYDVERFRIRFMVNSSTGQIINHQVSKSCTVYPSFPPPEVFYNCNQPMGSNSLTPTPITGGTKLTGEYENSDWLGRFGPDIDFTLEVKRTGDLLDIRYIGDGFPSVGFWRGYNGSWGNGIVLAEQTEWSLFGTADVACRFVLR